MLTNLQVVAYVSATHLVAEHGSDGQSEKIVKNCNRTNPSTLHCHNGRQFSQALFMTAEQIWSDQGLGLRLWCLSVWYWLIVSVIAMVLGLSLLCLFVLTRSSHYSDKHWQSIAGWWLVGHVSTSQLSWRLDDGLCVVCYLWYVAILTSCFRSDFFICAILL